MLVNLTRFSLRNQTQRAAGRSVAFYGISERVQFFSRISRRTCILREKCHGTLLVLSFFPAFEIFQKTMLPTCSAGSLPVKLYELFARVTVALPPRLLSSSVASISARALTSFAPYFIQIYEANGSPRDARKGRVEITVRTLCIRNNFHFAERFRIAIYS